MNRSVFVAALAGAAALAVVPIKTPALVPTYARLKLFAIDGGAPWVCAESEAAALAIVARNTRVIGYKPAIARMVPPSDAFVMFYEDEPPEKLVPFLADTSSECECSPETLKKYGCECCFLKSVNLPAYEWTKHLAEGKVIWEYQG